MMQSKISINQPFAIENSLSLQLATVFFWLIHMKDIALQSDVTVIDSQPWLNISPKTLCEHLPMVTQNSGRAAELLLVLEGRGFIDTRNLDGAWLISLRALPRASA